jgi:hypothetical protein
MEELSNIVHLKGLTCLGSPIRWQGVLKIGDFFFLPAAGGESLLRIPCQSELLRRSHSKCGSSITKVFRRKNKKPPGYEEHGGWVIISDCAG